MPHILITRAQVTLALLIQFTYHLKGMSGLDLDPDPSQEVTGSNLFKDLTLGQSIDIESIQLLENEIPPALHCSF